MVKCKFKQGNITLLSPICSKTQLHSSKWCDNLLDNAEIWKKIFGTTPNHLTATIQSRRFNRFDIEPILNFWTRISAVTVTREIMGVFRRFRWPDFLEPAVFFRVILSILCCIIVNNSIIFLILIVLNFYIILLFYYYYYHIIRVRVT